MSTTATIIFTALPNGLVQVDGGEALRLSVFISPRLERTEPPLGGESPVPLKDYPDVAAWPDAVSTMKWTVRLSPPGGGSELDLPAQAVQKSLDSGLWQALFPAETEVPRYRFDAELAKLPIVSYPAGELVDHIQKTYGEIGAEFPQDFPPAWVFLEGGELRTVIDVSTQRQFPTPDDPLLPEEVVALGRNEEDRVAHKERIELVRKKLGKTRTAYLLLRAFHHRVPAAAPYLPPPQLDFHQTVSTLGNYPSLLRRLGLVVDLVVPLPSPLPVVPALVHVKAEWAPHGVVELRSPRTLMGPDFRPLASDAADVASGYLRLESSRPAVPDGHFQLCQLDVDGAGLKLLSQVETVVRNESVDVFGPRRESLPALRSAGLGVLRRERDAVVEKSLDRSMALQNQPGATDELRAEDVLRGLRVDVLDETTQEWRTLHAQHGSYEIEGRTIQQPPEEGFTEPAATRPFAPKGSPGAPDGAPADALELHEKLFSWEGWSLSVAPEGKAHPQDPGPAPPPDAPPPPKPLVKAKLGVVPGSLPRLRFGRSYRLRARTVDLAGNSIRLEDAGEEHASPPERYLRFEPVDAPVVLPVLAAEKAYPPGESLERVAIRSERSGQPIELKKKAPPVRILVPPPAGQRTAEMHGVFDEQMDLARKLARQGKQALADALLAKVHQFVVEHDNKLPEWVTGQAIGEALAGLPRYLPDPLAFGVALRTLPRETAWVQSYYSTGKRTSAEWEEPRPIRIILARAGLTEQAAVKWSSKRRELTVRLRPSQVLRIDCSSCLCPRDLDLLQVWHWLVGASPAIAEAELDAIRGGLWMLTPKRQLVLVHAVKQPLLRPQLEEFDEQTARRGCGETALTFHDLPCKKPAISVHRASTSRVDVMAEYDEPVDDPSAPNGTRIVKGKMRAFDVYVPSPPEIGIAGELGLPRTALSLAEVKDNPDNPSKPLPKYRHEFGDTKYRRVRYRAVATTRFREYFEPVRGGQPANPPPALEESEFTREGDEVTIDVPSTARPVGVKVAYAIPTFAWRRGGGLLSQTEPQQEPSPEVREHLGFSSLVSPEDVRWSERKGNGLRIYLEGSWWSSGDGETLGVLLAPEGREDLHRYLPYVSTWGTDPVGKVPGRFPRWAQLPAQLPALRHFPRAIACHEGAQLAEVTGACGEPGPEPLPVAVAGHAVAFDPIRKLRYVDLDIDVGTVYFPFVRLALARFQPHSVAGVHLSSVTMLDFIQVTPDRILTVTSRELEDTPQVPGACATPWARTELVVTLLGPVRESQANEVCIDVQERRTLAEGDFGWVTLSSPDVECIPEAPPPGALYRAVLRLPAAHAENAARPARLLVKEYERHVEDAATLPEDARRKPGLRLVYAEFMHLRGRPA